MTIWLLESDVFGPGPHPLTAAVRRAGQRVIEWRDDWWSTPDALPPASDEPLIFHGSLGNAARIAALGRWSPGAYCAVESLRCSAWYTHARAWLANATFVFSTVHALIEDPSGVAGVLAGTSGRVFVRPDSPLKPFSGRVVALDGLTAAQLDHGFYYEDLELPIVIAPVREDLGREWRFVVVDQVVIASSGYVADGRRRDASDVPTEVRRVADEIVAGLPAPERVYVLDLVETSAGMRLLELNPFSGADLYGSDAHAVVAAVSQV